MAIENEFTMQELRDLREVFQVYDPSNTGSLTISDFRKVIKVLGFKVTRRRLQELMREEEIGKEGLITYTNLLQLVCRLQGAAYDSYGEIEQAFQFLDNDCDGKLSAKDLQAISKNYGLKLSPEDIDGMITEANRNGTGLITLQEFIEVMQKTPLFN
ncbi:PREDICTED: caltractin-like isoform X2 [Amphimedon queenslandica]|uniref:EF-hand domain-containing protein n=1 Tax=Amphimedon queenslandica TaxID=400682 RepID=A0A1X7UCA6_AMPQE|nr:PREDICTED: caltractin-like isoform X2 [Amphimedon queenslandica]|eukprot:XP_003388381.1 PREDICTED: caltractin-like isoform X2 [Amphimedon queenslandica]